MISYSTNWMGPINQEFINEYGSHWSGGRIDIFGDPDHPMGFEYSLPIMRTEDWNDFDSWLEDLETETLWTFEQIMEEYRQETGRVIRWWKDDADYMTAIELIRYIANEPPELSQLKIKPQRDHWQKMCKRWIDCNENKD